jgi:flagellar hook-length control protein FliK
VSENTPIPTASAHESSTLRAQTNFLPASEIRLAEVASVGRAAESMRSAVENPLLRPELVRQFNEIISRAQVLITDTQNAQFSVRLFPREIGRLEIDLKLIEGEIRGKIVVESENVKNELENFLQNREHSGSSREFDLNKIDIEVRSGNQNAQNPQQAPDTQEVLQNLVTQAASEAYNTIESSRVLGNALYA